MQYMPRGRQRREHLSPAPRAARTCAPPYLEETAVSQPCRTWAVTVCDRKVPLPVPSGFWALMLRTLT